MSTFDSSSYHHILPTTTTTTPTKLKNYANHFLRRFSSAQSTDDTRLTSSASIAMSSQIPQFDSQTLDVYHHPQHQHQHQQHHHHQPSFSFNAPTGRFILPPSTPAACEISQWITTGTATNSPVQPIHTQFPGGATAPSMTMSASVSSTASTATGTSTSTTSTSSSFPPSPDMYATEPDNNTGYALPTSASCLTINPTHQSITFSSPHDMFYSTSPHAPSSSYHQLMSPLEAANVYNGFATLGLGHQGGFGEMGVSPKDVMASSTMADSDDFGVGSPLDYPVIAPSFNNNVNTSPPTGFSPPTVFDFDFNTGTGGYGSRPSLFGNQHQGQNSPPPPHQHQHQHQQPQRSASFFGNTTTTDIHPSPSPPHAGHSHSHSLPHNNHHPHATHTHAAPQTQFALDLDFDLEEAQQTIRPSMSMGRPSLLKGGMSEMGVGSVSFAPMNFGFGAGMGDMDMNGAGAGGWNGPASAPTTGREFDPTTIKRRPTAVRTSFHPHHHGQVGSLPSMVKVEEGVVVSGNSMDMSHPNRARRLSRLGRDDGMMKLEHPGDEDDDEDDEEDDDDEDDEDGDGDYVEEDSSGFGGGGRVSAGGVQRSTGPDRPMRRYSHSHATSSAPGSASLYRKRGSPYSRPSLSTSLSSTSTSTSASASSSHNNILNSTRPRALSTASGSAPGSSINAMGTNANGTVNGKKPKAVKWESTKPKYWIPEGFDPYWDQKSRGRGVESVSVPSSATASSYPSSNNGSSSSLPGGSWGAGAGESVNVGGELPDDWKELVRGRGNPQRPFVCPAVNCGKTFQRSEHAKRHASSLHTPDAVKVPCPYEGCDHKSTRGDNLKQHIDSHRRKRDGGHPAGAQGGARGKKGRRSAKYRVDDDDEDD